MNALRVSINKILKLLESRDILKGGKNEIKYLNQQKLYYSQKTMNLLQ